MMIVSGLVVPLYSQVAIFDPDSDDAYPDWGDGLAEVTSTSHGVAIETISDGRGSVRIEVMDSYTPAVDDRVLFSGGVEVSRGRMVVGSVTGAELYEIKMVPGRHEIIVFTRAPRGEVDQLTIQIRR